LLTAAVLIPFASGVRDEAPELWGHPYLWLAPADSDAQIILPFYPESFLFNSIPNLAF